MNVYDFALHVRPQNNLRLFLGHDIKADISWPLSQSNPWNCITQLSIF